MVVIVALFVDNSESVSLGEPINTVFGVNYSNKVAWSNVHVTRTKIMPVIYMSMLRDHIVSKDRKLCYKIWQYVLGFPSLNIPLMGVSVPISYCKKKPDKVNIFPHDTPASQLTCEKSGNETTRPYLIFIRTVLYFNSTFIGEGN